MNLILILLTTTAILTFLSGLLSVTGAAKNDRGRIAWFFVSNLGAVIWAISCGYFLNLPPDATEIAPWFVRGIYIGAFVMLVPLIGFSGWKYRIGKVLTVLFIVASAVMSVLLIHDPSLLYSGIFLNNSGNRVELVTSGGWYYYAYAVIIALSVIVFNALTFYSARHARSKRLRNADYILLVGLSIAGVVSLVTNLIMPPSNYSLIWVGPLTLSVVMLTYFYAILKYRVVSVSTPLLKVLAYVVILTSGVVVYMLIFYLVFTALFKLPNPSASVLVLNFLMIVIVLLLMPVINEIMASINSMIQVGQVDIAYVIKKLNHLASRNVDLRDLAGFLADHLHFAYIGFIINGRLYGSKSLAMSPAELNSISHLKTNSRGVWQEPNKTVQKTFDELGLKAVAELRNAKGKTFGQLVVGKPLGKASFERRDLIQLEMIINLVATVIDSEKHLRA